MRTAVLTVALALPAPAFALPPWCDAATDPTSLDSGLDTSDARLAEGDLEGARAALADVHKGMLCLEVVAPTSALSRLGRQLALAFFFDQDDAAAERWLRSARAATTGGAWPTAAPAGHPVRDLDASLEVRSSGPRDVGLLAPKKGAAFLNGRFLAKPIAPVETPVFLQVTDKKGRVVEAWWQDGAAFPDKRVETGLAALGPPKWWTEPGDAVAAIEEPAVVEVAPTVAEPAEPTEADVVTEVTLDAYVDPFQDARRRRVVREQSERTLTNEGGDSLTVRTEIVSFIPDPSAGRPVTYGHFEQWLADHPDWHPDTAREEGRGDRDYLDGWDGYRHPDGARKLPVVRVSFGAARAYCTDFNTDLPPASLRPTDALTWEFRLDGDEPVRVSSAGKAKPVPDAAVTFPDTGFRCR